MTTLSVRLPDSVHRNARLYAEREGTSLNQLVATAVAVKLAALGAQKWGLTPNTRNTCPHPRGPAAARGSVAGGWGDRVEISYMVQWPHGLQGLLAQCGGIQDAE